MSHELLGVETCSKKIDALRRRSPVSVGRPFTSPNAALAGAHQHHDQVSGFIPTESRRPRSDGPIRWHRRIRSALAERNEGDDGWCCKGTARDPHMLDVVDSGFLVNTGKATNPRRCGCRYLVGWGSTGRLANSLRGAGYTPEEVDIVLLTHLHSDHVGA